MGPGDLLPGQDPAAKDAFLFHLTFPITAEHPRPKGAGVFFLCAGAQQTKTALPKQSRKDTSEINQRLENWGARRAAFRPYSPDLDPKSPVFMQVFVLPSLSKPTKSRNFWCSSTQPECCIHNAAQFLRFIMCSPPIYLHTQNPRTACHAKEPQSAQIIFM